MKSYSYNQTSETSETHKILQFLRSALLEGRGVGNVGNPFRVSDVLRPPAARRFWSVS